MMKTIWKKLLATLTILVLFGGALGLVWGASSQPNGTPLDVSQAEVVAPQYGSQSRWVEPGDCLNGRGAECRASYSIEAYATTPARPHLHGISIRAILPAEEGAPKANESKADAKQATKNDSRSGLSQPKNETNSNLTSTKVVVNKDHNASTSDARDSPRVQASPGTINATAPRAHDEGAPQERPSLVEFLAEEPGHEANAETQEQEVGGLPGQKVVETPAYETPATCGVEACRKETTLVSAHTLQTPGVPAQNFPAYAKVCDQPKQNCVETPGKLTESIRPGSVTTPSVKMRPICEWFPEVCLPPQSGGQQSLETPQVNGTKIPKLWAHANLSQTRVHANDHTYSYRFGPYEHTMTNPVTGGSTTIRGCPNGCTLPLPAGSASSGAGVKAGSGESALLAYALGV